MADITLPHRNPSTGTRPPGIALPTAQDVPTVNPAIARDPGVSAPAGAFDTGGAGLIDVANAGLKAADRLKAAEDRIAATRDANYRLYTEHKFGSGISELTDSFVKQKDILDPDVLKQYGAELDARKQAILDAHPGSEESRLLLQRGLDTMSADAEARFSIQATARRKEVVGGMMNTDQSRLREQLPVIGLDKALESWRGVVAARAPMLSASDEDSYRRAGESILVGDEIMRRLGAGHIDLANELFHSDFAMLDKQAQDRIHEKIVTQQVAANKGAQEAQQWEREFTMIMGRPPSAGERARKAASTLGPVGPQSLSQKIADIEKAVGHPLNQAQIEKAAGIATSEETPFGGGLTGRALSLMTDLAPSFASGLTTPEQDRQFVAAMTQYAQPTSYQNPDTGVMETRRPDLPPFVIEAARRRGIDIPALAQAQAQPQGTPSPQPGQPPPNPGVPEPAGQSQKTVWDLSGLATGVIPTVGEAIGKTPIIGDILPANEMTQARNYIPLIERNLVRVLQNNPRYAEGERKAIEDEINISPRMFDRAGAFQNRLIAIDQALQVREDNAYKTARNPNVGRDERVQAMNVLNGIMQFRQSLGVPPKVTSPQDYEKIQPGAQYIDPDGTVRVKGGKPQ